MKNNLTKSLHLIYDVTATIFFFPEIMTISESFRLCDISLFPNIISIHRAQRECHIDLTASLPSYDVIYNVHSLTNLVEIVKCLMQVCQHASGRFISDFDG